MSRNVAGWFAGIVVVLGHGALGGCTSSSPPPRDPSPESDGGAVGREAGAPAPDPTPREWRAAVGANGTFSQTFDEITWSTRSVSDRSLFSVTCVGNLRGWIAGERGLVAHTEDGGATWVQQDARLGADAPHLRVVRFGTATLGVVAGDNGALAVSKDGGATFRPVDTGVRVALRGAAVAGDLGVIVVVGDGGTILRSADAGDTWATVRVSGAGDLRGVSADAGAHLVLAVDGQGSIFASDDAARSFARETTAPAPLDAISLSHHGERALAVGGGGLAMRRGPSGVWATLATGTTADLHAALVPHEGTQLYVAGEGGALLTSADDGAHWARIALATTAPFYGLEDL